MIFSGDVPLPIEGPEPQEPEDRDEAEETATGMHEIPVKPGAEEELRQSLSPGEPGRYTVLRKIGSGGMGTVFKIYDHKLERIAAMKRLSPERADLTGVRRFFNEAKAIAKLNHPNIVTIFDINEDSRGFFILMEYVRGISMRAWVRRHGAIPPGLALSMIRQVADALHYAHRRGVIHRDVKPGNILVIEGLQPKLLDFGVALIGGGEGDPMKRRVAGTQGYMAPEQRWKGRPADVRSDIYAFSMTVVEIMVGMKPWLVQKMPPEIEGFVARGAAENPDARYGSMTEVMEALDGMIEHFTDSEGPVPDAVAARLAPAPASEEYFEVLCDRPRKYPLKKQITYVGRTADEADIVLEDEEVSRRHAKIVRTGFDTYAFDLKSKNGIVIDGKSVSGVRLAEGTVIRIGGTSMEYHRAPARLPGGPAPPVRS